MFLDGILLVMILSAIPLATAFFVGLVMSVIQAATQIQEQTLSFVPKLIAVVAVLVLLGPWMGQEVIDYMGIVLEQITKSRI